MPIYAFAGKKPTLSPAAFVHPEAVIIGDTIIDDDCFIAPGAILRADFGPIRIGRGTSIQDNAVIHVSPGDGVNIGSNVIVAHQVVLHDVTLGDRCVVGMGSIVMQKVVCEEDVFIAAGSLVPQGIHIPAGKMASGRPARIIKDVPAEMKAFSMAGAKKYQELARQYIHTMIKIQD